MTRRRRSSERSDTVPVQVGCDVLVKGVWHSLYQSGRLISHACILFEANAYSSAVALALFGHEEMGRCRILQDLCIRCPEGHALSPEQLREACADHVEKQRRGSGGLVYRTTSDTALGKLLNARLGLDPSSDAARATRTEVEKIDQIASKRQPADRHSARMRNVYVDLDGSSMTRVTPSTTEEEARSTLIDACNAYSIRKDYLTTPGILEAFEPAFAHRLREAKEPEFPTIMPPSPWPVES